MKSASDHTRHTIDLSVTKWPDFFKIDDPAEINHESVCDFRSENYAFSVIEPKRIKVDGNDTTLLRLVDTLAVYDKQPIPYNHRRIQADPN